MGVTNPLYQPYKALEKMTVIAAGVITACRFVDFAGAQATAAGGAIYGVAEMPALAAGERTDVITHGEAVVESGGAIAAVGTRVATDTQGRAVASASTNTIVGRALTTATAAGEFVLVLITREGVQ